MKHVVGLSLASMILLGAAIAGDLPGKKPAGSSPTVKTDSLAEKPTATDSIAAMKFVGCWKVRTDATHGILGYPSGYPSRKGPGIKGALRRWGLFYPRQPFFQAIVRKK